jgi:hypothetical protein
MGWIEQFRLLSRDVVIFAECALGGIQEREAVVFAAEFSSGVIPTPTVAVCAAVSVIAPIEGKPPIAVVLTSLNATLRSKVVDRIVRSDFPCFAVPAFACREFCEEGAKSLPNAVMTAENRRSLRRGGGAEFGQCIRGFSLPAGWQAASKRGGIDVTQLLLPTTRQQRSNYVRG